MDKNLRQKRLAKKKKTEPRSQILVRLTPKLMEALDRWRDGQLDAPTRPESVRRALARFLAEEMAEDRAKPRRPEGET